MKITIKIFLMMLCVGLSTNLMSMQQNNNIDTMLNEYIIYEPKYNKTSKLGITGFWAQSLVNRLSDDERVALIYECFTQKPNDNANEAYITRNLGNFAAAYAEMAKDATSSLSTWVGSGITGTVGAITSPFTSRIGRIGSWLWNINERELPQLEAYLKTYPNAYDSKKSYTPWLNQAIINAQKDFQNLTVFGKLTPEQQINKNNAAIDLIITKLMRVITESATTNKIKPTPTKETLKNQIITQWIHPTMQTFGQQSPQFTPQPQPQFGMNIALPNLDQFLQLNTNAYDNGTVNTIWQDFVLSNAANDFNTLKNYDHNTQISIIGTKILPIIQNSARSFGQNISQKAVNDWLVSAWHPTQTPTQQQGGRFGSLLGGGQPVQPNPLITAAQQPASTPPIQTITTTNPLITTPPQNPTQPPVAPVAKRQPVFK